MSIYDEVNALVPGLYVGMPGEEAAALIKHELERLKTFNVELHKQIQENNNSHNKERDRFWKIIESADKYWGGK